MGTVTLSTIHKDVDLLKKKISKLERQIKDPDRVLANDDLDALHQAELDYQKGRVKRLA